MARIYRKYARETDRRARIIDLCEPFDTIDLWIDPDPNAQLILVWLLEYLRPYEAIVPKLNLVQADVPIGNYPAEEVVEWRIPANKILNAHLELASSVWQAYRAPTPLDWFGLLSRDLSPLPLFRPAAIALLEELPGLATGLGATEMRMLELISEGNASPADVFPGHEKGNERRVLGYWEIGALLDGLARCPAPALSGLEEGLSRWRCTTIVIVTNVTSKADCRSRNSARPFRPRVTISAGTTRSIGGGAGPN